MAGKSFHAPERTVERGRGCWNCSKFDNDVMAKQHYKVKTEQEKMAIRMQQLPALDRLANDDASVRDVALQAAKLIKQGFDQQDAENIATAAVQRELGQIMADANRADARFQQFDAMIASGQVGLCIGGHSPGDFVECRYLCGHWNGATGHSVATSGHTLDKLPDELMDRADSAAKKA